jgi:hypothetical protein
MLLFEPRSVCGVSAMTSPSLDIFREDRRGNPVWVDAVEDLERARLRVNRLTSAIPGEYFVFDQRTRQIVVRLGLARMEWT